MQSVSLFPMVQFGSANATERASDFLRKNLGIAMGACAVIGTSKSADRDLANFMGPVLMSVLALLESQLTDAEKAALDAQVNDCLKVAHAAEELQKILAGYTTPSKADTQY